MNHSVDVVIPSFQRRELTLEAVYSVLDQTFRNFRIFVIEDGSQEFEEGELKALDGRILYKRNERNRGPAWTRNFGASLGSSSFIAFLDSDDLWHKEKTEKQLRLFQENPRLQWAHTDEAWFRNGEAVKQRQIHKKQGGQFVEKLMQRCLISPSAVLFRRDFFMAHRFAPHFRVAEDYELWLRLNFLEPVGFLDFPATIKRAGDWPQLSSTLEIDFYRVLALHRFYKKYSHLAEFEKYKGACRKETIQKLEILYKGAMKYSRLERARQYQSWIRRLTI